MACQDRGRHDECIEARGCLVGRVVVIVWLEVVERVHEGFEVRDLDLVWDGRGEGDVDESR